jgi:hypothetical protein
MSAPVRDTGLGMPKRSNTFLGNSLTKQTGKGTGLGLSICGRKQNRGRIFVAVLGRCDVLRMPASRRMNVVERGEQRPIIPIKEPKQFCNRDERNQAMLRDSHRAGYRVRKRAMV